MDRKVYSLGEALIDFIPEVSGEPLKEVMSFKKAPGGAPANVAAAVAKLGCESYFIGKFGTDAFGDFLIDTLIATGVKDDCISRTDRAKTALAFVSLKKDGERDFMFYRDPSADMLLTNNDIHPSWFSKEDILHFGSISLIENPAKAATEFAILEARKNETLISYDPNLRLPLWPTPSIAKDTILEYLPFADIVKISDDELEFLTGTKDDDAVKELFVGNVKLIFLTFGSKGAKIYSKTENFFLESYKVNAVDATGAGDAFWGGVLCKLIEHKIDSRNIDEVINKDIMKDILRFANASGALTATRRGAISALPSTEEILNFIGR